MNGVFMKRSWPVCDAHRMSVRPHLPFALARRCLLGAALAGLLGVASAQPQNPPARLSDAVRSGQILPLAHFSEHALRHFGGRVIEVELEREKEGPRYELELLLEDGRVLELVYDAASGQLLEVEGHRLETVFGRQGRPYP